MSIGLAAKRLEILHDLLPAVRIIAFLANRTSSAADPFVREIEAAAGALGKQAQVVDVRTDSDLIPAFESMVRQKAGALVVSGDQFLFSKRARIVQLAARYQISAIYYTREYVKSGGLISYGADDADASRQVGIITGRILKGEKAADLPVQQATKIELCINLKTAKALDLDLPATVLVRADEMIE